MKYLRVNDHDMAYIEVGNGRPLVCVHGTFNDFRCWSPVLGPLSRKHRVIALSLRHFFPEQWDGRGGKFTIAQHVSDMIIRPALGLVRGGSLAVCAPANGLDCLPLVSRLYLRGGPRLASIANLLIYL